MIRFLIVFLIVLRWLGRAWTAPHTAVTGASISSSDHNTKIRDNLNHLYNNLPLRQTMFHDQAKVVTGGAIARVVDASQSHNFRAAQATPANGDTFKQSCVLGAGTYTLHVLGKTNTTHAMIDWYLDDVLKVSGQDWYSGSYLGDIEKTAAGIVVAEGGRHVLKGVINGRNASSTGWFMQLTAYWFEPASE